MLFVRQRAENKRIAQNLSDRIDSALMMRASPTWEVLVLAEHLNVGDVIERDAKQAIAALKPVQQTGGHRIHLA
jgi:hypothetical protein